jgi:PKD repeat protein
VFTSMLPHTTIVPPALKLNTLAAFQSTAVLDPVGAGPYAYQWLWGDGATTTTSSATASHAFTKSGTYLVALRVTDSLGRTGTVFRTVVVGMPLIAKISGPTTARANVVTTYASSGSIDPNTGGVITAWRWRAGSTASNATVVGTAATLHLTYHNKGKHILLLDITDNAGLHTTTSITVNVI